MDENKSLNSSFIMYYADCLQNATNCYYTHKAEIRSLEDFRKICSHDYVSSLYKDNRRSNANFLECNCITGDIDNSGIKDNKDFITPNDLRRALPGVEMYIHYSRNNMKEKNGESPRPKFHFTLGIDKVTSLEQRAKVVEKLKEILPFIDEKALDAGHFFFGTENPDVIHIEGNRNFSSFIRDYDSFATLERNTIISEGQRHKTMLQIAVRLLKRYGDNANTYQNYLERSNCCSPLLDSDELNSIYRSAQGYYSKIRALPNYKDPNEYNNGQNQVAEPNWEEPLSLDEANMPPFPIDALPSKLREYCLDVAECTQTPVDMAAVAAIGVASIAMQDKYKVMGKDDWVEQTNLYSMIVAEPSDRKSAVLNHMSNVLISYEADYNAKNELAYEKNHMEYDGLVKKKNRLSKLVDKDPDKQEELDEVINKLASFKLMKKLALTVDDVTPEVLANKMEEQDDSISIVSSEGGIFDIMAGAYSKLVNIDILLKGYSGDKVRVDRIGRPSISINKPKLSILLTVQPSVLRSFVSNGIFSGRGLSARFLYSIPKSRVGTRTYLTKPIRYEAKQDYENLITSILSEDKTLRLVTLSDEAMDMIVDYSNDFEKRLPKELKEMSAWAGKFIGNILRISAIITRCNEKQYPSEYFFDNPSDADMVWIVQKSDMEAALKIGEYYLANAIYAFKTMNVCPEKDDAVKLLEKLKSRPDIKELTPRDAMRICRSFKTTKEIVPAMNFLSDYGYLKEKESDKPTVGRPKSQIYLVNPYIYAA